MKNKRYKELIKEAPTNPVSKQEAISVSKSMANAKFDESIDLIIVLGIDTKLAEENIRTTVSLPAGTGKEVRIGVFAGGEALSEAEQAGAEVVGGKDLATKVKSEGDIDVDIIISTPEMMSEVGQLGKILGPKGLMPNPKTGTVTTDVAKAVTDFKKGKVEIKNDKLGNVHLSIGKASFEVEKLLENFDEVLAEVNRAKPASSKGDYIKKVYISSTMGPSVNIDLNK
jgi:large subunit ribosomal protein L1